MGTGASIRRLAEHAGFVFGLLLAVKAALLVVDPGFRLFLGDSATYLHSALTLGVPHDRSFTYGGFVRATAVWGQSLFALVLAQSLLGVLLAQSAWWVAVRQLRGSPSLGLALSLLLALEPGQLYYERAVMAETPGLFALAAFLAAGVAYLRTPRLLWLPVLVGLGLAAVSLRFTLTISQ